MALRNRIGIGLLILTLILTACAAPDPAVDTARTSDSQTGAGDQPAVKKRIVSAIRGEPATLSAIIDSSGVGGTAGVTELEELISVGMLELVDNRVATRTRLATSIPTVENGEWKVNPDGTMQVTFKIRPNAKWHDGTPVTGADFVFTTEVSQDPELTILSNNAFTYLDSVEAPDASTVVAKWNRVFILAHTMFSNGFALPLPKHILEPVYREQKAAFAEHPFWTEEFIGAGPFRVREFVRSSHVNLEAFDDYVLGRPKIDEIEVKFINDPNVILANVLAGTVNFTIGRGLAPEEGFEAERQWQNGKVDYATGTSWTAMFAQNIDPNPPVLGDVRFRRALMHATNRQQLADTLAMGKSRVVSSYVGPNAPEFNEVQSVVPTYDFDQRRAAQMITELGFTKGPDGLFVNAAGQPLSIEIRTTAGDELRANATFAIADMWKQMGIGTETLIIPRQQARDREYRVTRPAFELTHQPNQLHERALQRFMTKEIPSAPQWRGNNRARYASPEYDALVEKYLVTLSQRESLQLAKDINRHLMENLPALGLLYRIEIMLIGSNLENISTETNVRNAHEWNMKM